MSLCVSPIITNENNHIKTVTFPITSQELASLSLIDSKDEVVDDELCSTNENKTINNRLPNFLCKVQQNLNLKKSCTVKHKYRHLCEVQYVYQIIAN